MSDRNDDGFTLIEMVVGIFLLSVLAVGFYQVMLSSVRGSQDTADIARIAEEARLGFNRMIRDMRETTKLVTATGTEYVIWVDFNDDGDVDDADLEYLRYSYDEANEIIELTALSAPAGGNPDLLDGTQATLAGTSPETLASNVRLTGTHEIFDYSSNFLQYDADGDGEVDTTELEDALEATGVGVENAVLEGVELDYISDVNYAFVVAVGDKSRTFFGQAQIRNRRYSNL